MTRKARTKPPRAPKKPRPKPSPGISFVDENQPTIALVGRPNVGKSSLFNALLKEQISITDARAGTTRDRVLHPVVLDDKPCELLDTGGIGIVDKEDLSDLVETQIDAALATASIFALIVDAKEGLTPMDTRVARRLRALGRPVVLVVNKTEGLDKDQAIGEFARLGYDQVVATSAVHRLGIGDLEEALATHLPDAPEEPPGWEDLPKLAVVGRRNVGKSSFVNALAKKTRAIVSDVAGTTRDAVDLFLKKDNQKFCLIDTAGLRRIKEPHGPVEFFAQVRTERALRRADVVLLMLEAKEGISTTDQKTANLIVETFKPCVIVVNKWDQAKDLTTSEYADYVEKRLPGLRFAPICFTTAIEAQRCWQTIDVALEVYKLSRTEVSTGKLNRMIDEAERKHEPPIKKTKKPKLMYGVQVAVGPPTFVVYCRHAEKIDDRYNRYMSRFLREHMDLEEIPVRVFFREAPRDDPRKRFN